MSGRRRLMLNAIVTAVGLSCDFGTWEQEDLSNYWRINVAKGREDGECKYDKNYIE